MGVLKQVRYLLYRNFLLKKRNKKQTAWEVISVLYFVAILATLRKFAIRPKTDPAISDSAIPKFAVYRNKLNMTVFPVVGFPPPSIGYVLPKGSSEVNGEQLIARLKPYIHTNFKKFQSEKELEDAHKSASNNFTVGLILNVNTAERTVDYTIKVPYNKVPDPSATKQTIGLDKCRNLKNTFSFLEPNGCPVNSYYSSSFASIQSLVDNAIAEVLTNKSSFIQPKITIQMFPKGEYKTPLQYLTTIVSIYMVMAFSPYILFLLTFVVTEKEKKIKEAMKIMGLSTYAFWLGWFITYAVVISIGVAFVTIIAAVSKLFGDSDYFIIFLFFLFYGLSIETLSFMLTPLFQKGRTAGMAGSMGTIVLSTLSMIHIYLKTSNAVKWVTGFLSPVALSLALTPALDTQGGVTWSNIATKGDFPALYGLILLIIDTILYLLLAVYFDSVFPGEYGQRKHPLFCFKLSYWKSLTQSKEKNKRQMSFMRSHSVKEDEQTGDVEEAPEELLDRKVISIRKIRKVFKGSGKTEIKALDGISLDVYEGQITALLGHNGAGKSTLISALTGMIPVSGGSAFLYDLNIRKSEDMDKIRRLIGLCPQQNIIFDELTPREHLQIFAGIKGVDSEDIEHMVNTTLKEIDLSSQENTIAKNLSGGQKRKLCVGIALIGDPKVIFLDEPTSGMDPASRRYMWSLLQSKREDRVIFLTTHFMDEADILADYKAIISKGKLRCAGSSLFLKSRFGIGYYLGMVVEPDCDRLKVSDLVSAHVPGAEVSREHSKELAFRLPLKDVDKFPDLFNALEKQNDSSVPCSAPLIGVTSYGVSMTTLEEVFLKLDEEQNDEEGEEMGESLNGSTEHLVLDDGLEPKEHLSSSSVEVDVPEMKETSCGLNRFQLQWQQFVALMEVRFKASIRSFMKLFFQCVVPPILLIAGFVVMKNTNTSTVQSGGSNLEIGPQMYLQQRSNPGKEILIQNATSGDINKLLKSFDDEKLKYRNIKSLGNLMAVAPHSVAYGVQYVNSTGQVEYILRYNDSNVYSIPVGINTMSNVQLRMAFKKVGVNYTGRLNPIRTFTKPFRPAKPLWKYDGSSFAAVMLLGITFAIMPNGFSIEVVQNRQLGIRHQLRVSGTSRLVYWLVHLVGDIVCYIFPVVLCLILVPAFDIKAFNSSVGLGSMVLLLLLYIPNSLLFIYNLSFAFNNWETIQNVMGTVLILIAMIPYVAVSVVDMVSADISGSKAAQIMHLVFLIIDPPYAIFGGLYFLSRIWRVNAILSQDNNVKVPASKYFEWSLSNGLPATFLVMFVQILFLSWLLALLDMWKAGGILVWPLSLLRKSKKSENVIKVEQAEELGNTKVNEDVKREKEKVRNCTEAHETEKSVLVKDLQKDFGKKRVVNDLSFLVEHGEIFGLLGPNGAGKTTTLNMITADFKPTKGQIYVAGHNISTDLDDAFQNLGYCPQHDALWELVTLKEHLKCYALLKGVPKNRVDTLVRHFMVALRITEHANKKAKDLSGGTKRKLSFLMSAVGSPGTMMMDEPSTGMDPAAKRFLWTVISNNITDNRGAILTTHSMEEADALCHRVGIIVKGQLRCIGTTQELKTNYGGGYHLEIKAKSGGEESLDDKMAKIKNFVLGIFPDAVEDELFGNRVIFKVPQETVGHLSNVFASFERGKQTLDIEEYSFSQSTLEHVFLEFAKEQDDELTGKVNGSYTQQEPSVTL